MPNTLGCDNLNDGNTGGWGNIVDAMPPSSNHSGGVNVGMCDGSVRFIKNSVNLQPCVVCARRRGTWAK